MAVAQKANSIILDLGSAKSEDFSDLRYGQGKLFKRIASAVERLKEQGEVAEDAQPVIVVVRRKK